MSRIALFAAAIPFAVTLGQECSLRLELPRSRFNQAGVMAHLPGAPAPGLYAAWPHTRDGPALLDYATFQRWDGSMWVFPDGYPELLYGGGPGPIEDLCVFDDGTGPAIYACGFFDSNELGEPVRKLAKWTGEKWVEVGGGVNDQPRALCVFDDGRGPALYVGGRISEAGGRFVSNIAKWDGDVWSDVGGGVWSGGPDPLNSMVVFDDGSGPALFVGGQLTHAGGQFTLGVAKWTGREWVGVAPGASWQQAWIKSLAVHDDGPGPALYAGGHLGWFSGGLQAHRGIVRWNGEEWSNVGETVSRGEVNSLAVFDDGSGPQLYASGGLTEWFGHLAGLARWDGVEWHEIRYGERPLGATTMAAYDDGSGPALWFSGGDGTKLLIGRLRCVSDSCDFADCDRSGRLDFFDFLCYQNLFAAADPGADCDGSGDLTFLDFLCFQNAFAAGCP